MDHGLDVAQGNETRAVAEVESERRVAHIPPGEGIRSLWVFGELGTHKIPSEKTGGAYALFEVTTRPGAGPPPHVHHREDESFYVLEGEYEFLSGRETVRVGAGSLVYVSKGNLHAHKNVGEGMGRMLMSQTPGGLYELFFAKAGRTEDTDDGGTLAFEEWPDARRRIVEVAAEHGMEIPAPNAEKDKPTTTTQRGRW